VGTEDIDDRFIDQTYAAIRSSDAVVMTLNMTQPLAESEQRFIETHLRGTGKKVFLVVNKADARSPEQQTEVLDDLRHRFSTLYRSSEVRAEERIFAVSAKTGQGLNDLRERLVHFVTQERLTEMLLVHGAGLRERLMAWSSACRHTLHGYEAKQAGDEARLREAERNLRDLAERLEHDRDRLDDLRDDLASELQARITDLKEKCDRELRSLDQQGASVQVIRTDLARVFSAGIMRLINQLQSHARKELQLRIGKLLGMNELRVDALDEASATALEGVIAKGGTILGGGSIIAGLTSAVLALQTAAATPIPWWGIGGTTGTTLFAGALAPWAIPAIVVGAGAFWGSKKYRETRERQRRETFINSARNDLDQDCSNLEPHLREQLNSYITTSWQQAEERVAQARSALEELIAETDLSTLEARITSIRDEEKRLNGLVQRVDSLLRAVG
jgi:predicted  nucleic acid-binding Zn-ribbon protein